MAEPSKLVELYAEPPVVEVIDRLASKHDLTRSAVVDAALRLLASGFKPSEVRVAPRRQAGVRIPVRLVDRGSLRAWNRVATPRSARLRGVFLDVAAGREGVEEQLAEQLALAPLRNRRWPRSANDPTEEEGRSGPG